MDKNVIELFKTIINAVEQLNEVSSEHLSMFPYINLTAIGSHWFHDLDYIGIMNRVLEHDEYMHMIRTDSTDLKTILPMGEYIEIGEYTLIQERENDEYYLLKTENEYKFDNID